MLTQTRLIQSCKILLFINAFFWLIAAFYFSFIKYPDNKDYLAIKILLAMEPIGYLVLFYAVVKKWKVIYSLGLYFVLFNCLLSITDQMGFVDALSLLINAALLLNMMLIWKRMMSKIK